jgi:hypothetical protein
MLLKKQEFIGLYYKCGTKEGVLLVALCAFVFLPFYVIRGGK